MKLILTVVSAAFLILHGCGKHGSEDDDFHTETSAEPPSTQDQPKPPTPPSLDPDTIPADEDPLLNGALPPSPYDTSHAAGNGTFHPVDYLDSMVAQLDSGSLSYLIPEEMKAGISSKVEVRLIRKVGAEAVLSVTKDTPPGVESIVDTIRTSAVMSVRLQGNNFEIVELSNERQIVISFENTRWEWLVTPLSSGSHTLKITAIAHLIAPPDLDEVWDLPIYSKQVKVAVNLPYSFSKIWTEHWEWFLGTLIIPLVIELYRRVRKSKKKQKLKHS